MNITLDTADTFLATVAGGDLRDPAYFPEVLGEVDAPIYVTDEEGFVTYFNRACVGFSGREPAVGKDRWCVTWKLFTADGDYLPHDQCPMAVAIKTEKLIRGVTAVAARPDGTRQLLKHSSLNSEMLIAIWNQGLTACCVLSERPFFAIGYGPNRCQGNAGCPLQPFGKQGNLIRGDGAQQLKLLTATEC